MLLSEIKTPRQPKKFLPSKRKRFTGQNLAKQACVCLSFSFLIGVIYNCSYKDFLK